VQDLKKGVNELVAFDTGSMSSVPTATFDAKLNINANATSIGDPEMSPICASVMVSSSIHFENLFCHDASLSLDQ
jgi:hypothetical protein